jgi:hypothetical protein
MNIEIGDEVWFKNDVEGQGIVLDIIRDTFVIGQAGGENSTYPWHRMAQFDYDRNRMVVWVDSDHVWKE